MQEYWFKADLLFWCPSCKKVSKETILARAPSRVAVPTAVIERVEPICQLCHAACQNAMPFQIVIKDLTPEELANLKIADTSVQAVV